MRSVECIEFGVIDYAECLERQREVFDGLIEHKNGVESGAVESLVLCQHPHVYTIGKSGAQENILVGEEFLAEIKAEVVRIDRGGDVTYHGPGQLVGYPILDLERGAMGLKEYIHKLEQSIIELLAEFGIEGRRIDGLIGIWVGEQAEEPRKIAAIGVRSSRYVTMHGFALNVAPDLDYFGYINPCGFKDRGVTSIRSVLGREVSVEEVAQRYKKVFESEFSVRLVVRG